MAAFPNPCTGQWYDLNSIGNNAGASSPDVATLLRWAIGTVGYAKFIPPIALWILGVGAWFCFRQMKLSPLAAMLGGLAAALSSTFSRRRAGASPRSKSPSAWIFLRWASSLATRRRYPR